MILILEAMMKSIYILEFPDLFSNDNTLHEETSPL